MVRRAISIQILISILIGTAFGTYMTALADVEPNDTLETAEGITPGSYIGSLHDNGDSDIYVFDIVPGDRVNISRENTGSVTAYLGDGMSLNYYFDEKIIFQTNSDMTLTKLYLYFSNYMIMESYSFNLDLIHANDAGSGTDASSKFNDSIEIIEGKITGELDSTYTLYGLTGLDPFDVYKFHAGPGDIIGTTFTSSSTSNSTLYLLDTDRNVIAQMNSTDGSANSDSYILANESAGGWYYLKVEQFLTKAHYSIDLDILPQNESGSGQDAPSDIIGAPDIIPGNTEGKMGGEDISDTYNFLLPSGHIANVSLVSMGNTTLELLNMNNTKLGTSVSSGGHAGPVLYTTDIESAPIELFLKLTSDEYVDYEIHLSIDPQDDAGSGHDANSSFDTMTMIEEGSYTGFIGDMDQKDTYRLHVSPGMTLNITFTPEDSPPTQAAFYDSEGVLGFSMQSEAGMPVWGRSCYTDQVASHDAFITVGPGSGPYSLKIDSSLQDDIGSGGDAYSGTDYLAGATPLVKGSFIGYLDNAGDTMDTYGIEIQKGQTLNVTVDPIGPMSVNLRNSTGTVVGMFESTPPGSPIVISWEAIENGKVAIIITSYSGHGFYTIDVDISGEPAPGLPSAPILMSVPGVGKIDLSWFAPSNDGGSAILGYRVYRGDSESTLTLLAAVGPLVLEYPDTSVVPGSTYVYKVAAYTMAGEGARSVPVSGSPLSTSLDRDADGIPNEWETDHSMNPDDPSDANVDDDGDGRSNLQEYKDGTDPQVKDKKEKDGFEFKGIYLGGVCCIVLVIVAIILAIVFVAIISRRKRNHTGEE